MAWFLRSTEVFKRNSRAVYLLCHVIRRGTVVVTVRPLEEVVLHYGKVTSRVVDGKLRLGLECGRRLHTFISRATLFKIICYYKELSVDNQLNSA